MHIGQFNPPVHQSRGHTLTLGLQRNHVTDLCFAKLRDSRQNQIYKAATGQQREPVLTAGLEEARGHWGAHWFSVGAEVPKSKLDDHMPTEPS